MNNFPQRKPNRLKNISYNENGAYFITICTKDKKHIFWSNCKTDVGASFARPLEYADKYEILSVYGKTVDEEIRKIDNIYPTVKIDKYVIMPNHIHMIIVIETGNGRPQVALPWPRSAAAAICTKSAIENRLQGQTGNGRPQVAPTVSRIVQQFKGAVTKKLGFSPWQKLFHDHVIRDEQDYLSIWQYIDSNPAKWQDDIYFN